MAAELPHTHTTTPRQLFPIEAERIVATGVECTRPAPSPELEDFLRRSERIMAMQIVPVWSPPNGYGWQLSPTASEREKDLVYSLQCASSTLDYTRMEFLEARNYFRWYVDLAKTSGITHESRIQQAEYLLACYLDARTLRDKAYERMRQTTCAGGTHPVVLPTACAIEIMRFLYPTIVKH